MYKEYMGWLITLRSESDTPKSRLETKSFALPSASPLWAPSSCSSNMSCCHLSGSSLGCGRQHNLHWSLCFTPLLKGPASMKTGDKNRHQVENLSDNRNQNSSCIEGILLRRYSNICIYTGSFLQSENASKDFFVWLMLLTWPLDKKRLEDSSHLGKKVHLNQGHFHTLTSGRV